MGRTFNCGVGMVLVVGPDMQHDVMRELQQVDMEAAIAGHLHPRSEGIKLNTHS